MRRWPSTSDDDQSNNESDVDDGDGAANLATLDMMMAETHAIQMAALTKTHQMQIVVGCTESVFS